MRPQGHPNWMGPSFPHHSGKAAGLELPFSSPLYLSGAGGGGWALKTHRDVMGRERAGLISPS